MVRSLDFSFKIENAVNLTYLSDVTVVDLRIIVLKLSFISDFGGVIVV